MSCDMTPWAAWQSVSFTAYAACTGGGSVGLDVAGSAHEVGEVVAERGEVTVQVTEPNEGTSSAWGVALAQG